MWLSPRLGAISAKRERRGRVLAGVDEQRRLRAVEIERMLDLQLEILDRRDVRPAGARHAREQQRPQPVVAARVVAPAEDDEPQVAQPLRARETSAPSASTRSTSSGILPSAWVAQDRHGS